MKAVTGASGLVLTLSGHHPLRVPLGQHPHVTVEAGLLHWGGRRERKWIYLAASAHGSRDAALTSGPALIRLFPALSTGQDVHTRQGTGPAEDTGGITGPVAME